jgi:outer membrane protein assembly factor BamB
VTPAVAGELVLIGSCAGTFYALDRANGKVRWQYDIRGDGKQTSFHGDPVIDAGRVFFDTDYGCAPDGIGHIYAAEIGTGKLLWKYKSQVGVSTNLRKVGQEICFGTIDGAFGCVNESTGELAWRSKPQEAAGACDLPKWLAGDQRHLFTVGRDGEFVAFDASTGAPMWHAKLPARVVTSPAVVDDVLFVGGEAGAIYAVRAATGELLSTAKVEGRLTGHPTVSNGNVYFVAESANGKEGLLVCLRASDRAVSWVHRHPRTLATDQPAVWKDVVFVGDCAGELLAFQSKDGSIIWRMALKGCLRSIGVSGAVLYVGAQEGTVYAVPANKRMKLIPH